MNRSFITQTIKEKFLHPLLVCFVSRMFFSLIAAKLGYNPWSANCWLRWDSHLYLDIAKKGYEFVSCKEIGFGSINDACGNTGWFPGYSILIYILHLLLGWSGLELETCAVIIPLLFFFLILYGLWNQFLDSETTFENILILLIVAFFPGCIYFHAGFPISTAGFFSIALLSSMDENKKFKPWIAGFLAGISYALGFIAGGFPMVHHFFKRRFRLAAILGLSGLAGFGAVLIAQWRIVGIWGTFFDVQKKYGHSLRSPLESIFGDLTTFGWDGPHIQSTLVSAFMLVGLAFLLWKEKRGKALPLEWAIFVGAAGFWLIPHLLGGEMTSYFRGEALIFPSALLLKGAPKALLFVVLFFFCAIAFFMGGFFFQGLIV